MFFYVGAIGGAVLAYFVRNWRYLVLITGAYWLVLSIPLFFMDRSPIFLLQTGNIKEFSRVVKGMAKVNKKTLDKNFDKFCDHLIECPEEAKSK